MSQAGMAQAEVKKEEKVFWVNPRFKIRQFGGEVITMDAVEAMLKVPLTFAQEDDARFQQNMESFLNEAYAQGWVYWTTIAGTPVFRSGI